MKTKAQRIIAFAKKHPNGFKPKQLLEATKMKDANIWVTLSKMKKRGLLSHDAEAGVYKPGAGEPRRTGRPAKSKDKAVKPVTKDVVKSLTAQVSRDVDTIAYLSNQLIDANNKYNELQRQHEEALILLRYVENKLVIAIQHHAKN